MLQNNEITDVQQWLKEHQHLLESNPELAALAGTLSSVKPSKYRNVRVKDPDGQTYGSGQEAADARNFTLAVAGGQLAAYRHDVPLLLPGGVRMKVDHLIVTNDFKVELADTKAWDVKLGKYRVTRDWRNKQKQVREKFGLEIKLI